MKVAGKVSFVSADILKRALLRNETRRWPLSAPPSLREFPKPVSERIAGAGVLSPKHESLQLQIYLTNWVK